MRTLVEIDPLIKVSKLDDVIEKPVVIRVTGFEEKDLEDFEEDFDDACNSGQKIIPIVIDSYGGSVHSTIGMVSSIENSPLPVATICTTKCMSAGAVLFGFGHEGYRFMHPDASMMIHDASWGTAGKVEEMKTDTQYLDSVNKRMFRKLSKHIRKPPDFILDMIKTKSHLDWFINSREAKKIGIANHLRVPKFEVKIKAEVNFI